MADHGEKLNASGSLQQMPLTHWLPVAYLVYQMKFAYYWIAELLIKCFNCKTLKLNCTANYSWITAAKSTVKKSETCRAIHCKFRAYQLFWIQAKNHCELETINNGSQLFPHCKIYLPHEQIFPHIQLMRNVFRSIGCLRLIISIHSGWLTYGWHFYFAYMLNF